MTTGSKQSVLAVSIASAGWYKSNIVKLSSSVGRPSLFVTHNLGESSCSLRSRRHQGQPRRRPATDILTIVGANGAGKSTILKSIVGELPPFHGEIRLRGPDTTRDPAPPGRAAPAAHSRTPSVNPSQGA
ncbi:MAG: ATP-binding cassette domain-containing protein [Candidatus Rokubacteria bacterium]|nr:ATP-binding cassette domain-containing protein [Candidatus Rokubacteria bacterium]